MTEFVCLAMESATGRQLGRYHRFARVTKRPPQLSPSPPLEVALGGRMPDAAVGNTHSPVGSTGGESDRDSTGGPIADDARTGGSVRGEGSVNPWSTALPFPELLEDLERWLASLGLNAGPPDEEGFAERGNFRCVHEGKRRAMGVG